MYIDRVVAHVDGNPKHLLSFKIGGDNSLYIFIAHAEMMRDYDKTIEDEGSSSHRKVVQMQKYSIHPSVLSPEMTDKNMIKHFIEAEDEKPSSVHFTRAIKATKKLTPLFFKQCPELLVDRYDIDDSEGPLRSLCAYDPRVTTLFYGVFVGSRDTDMRRYNKLMQHKAIKFYTFVVGEYRLVILYSFLTMPSLNTGCLNHIITSDPRNIDDEEFKKLTLKIMDGMDADELLNMAEYRFNALRENTVRLHKEMLREVAGHDIDKLIWAFVFIPEGRKESLAYRKFMKHGPRG